MPPPTLTFLTLLDVFFCPEYSSYPKIYNLLYLWLACRLYKDTHFFPLLFTDTSQVSRTVPGT